MIPIRGWGARTGKPLTPEKQAQTQIMAYLCQTGWHVRRNQQGLGNKKGRSDIIATRWGITLHLEVKAPPHLNKNGKMLPAGKPSLEQLAEQAEIRAHGGIYEFVSTIEEVERIVKNLRIVIIAKGGLLIVPEKSMRLSCE